MGRFSAAALALVLTAPAFVSPAGARSVDRTLPMRFDLRMQGPNEACGGPCKMLVGASGAITADTPQDFKNFARGHDLAGALMVLDSDGGSVHGAIALGREIRRVGLDTTVGRIEDLDVLGRGIRPAKINPRAECESMCAFVLLAGVRRSVPSDARVMVHQIWLGDRREDPTAANYSAEDLVLVQRDIGRLAQYTSDMGGSIELLDLALRIPPWEPMHALTAAELRRTRVETQDLDGAGATVAASPPPAPAAPTPARMTNGIRAAALSEQRWAMIDRGGSTMLARRHPLTIEGDGIGSFDLFVACGPDRDTFDVTYLERRHGSTHAPLPREVGVVAMAAAGSIAKLKVTSSKLQAQTDELVTYAAGTLPAKLIAAFAGPGKHSMMVTTRSGDVITAIRLGNTGAQQNLPQLAAACQTATRAAMRAPKAGGFASAQ